MEGAGSKSGASVVVILAAFNKGRGSVQVTDIPVSFSNFPLTECLQTLQMMKGHDCVSKLTMPTLDPPKLAPMTQASPSAKYK